MAVLVRLEMDADGIRCNGELRDVDEVVGVVSQRDFACSEASMICEEEDCTPEGQLIVVGKSKGKGGYEKMEDLFGDGE